MWAGTGGHALRSRQGDTAGKRWGGGVNNPNETNLKLCANLILSNNVMLEGNVHNMPFPPNTPFS